jgi:HTH-like domain/Integrase core domain
MNGGKRRNRRRRTKRRGILALIVQKSFDESDGTYGYRRVHADLAARGVPAGPELVRSIMRDLGLEACQPKPWRFSLTEGDGQEHGIPDRVKRDFTADAPGQKMVGDITCIPTWEGWLYLATVIDCHTKAVIGWATDAAAELAAAYHERWEAELVFGELKTHQRGAGAIIRSRKPELVEQEIWGLLLTHYGIRHLMREAADQAELDPDRMSFMRALRVVRRQVSGQAAFSPSEARGSNAGSS